MEDLGEYVGLSRVSWNYRTRRMRLDYETTRKCWSRGDVDMLRVRESKTILKWCQDGRDFQDRTWGQVGFGVE